MRRPIVKVSKCATADDSANGGLENIDLPRFINFVKILADVAKIPTAEQRSVPIKYRVTFCRFACAKRSNKVRVTGYFQQKKQTPDHCTTQRAMN